jgi:hypothetical protein
VQQDPAFELPASGPEALRLRGNPHRVPLEPLDRSRGQHDTVASDLREVVKPDGDLSILAAVQRYHLPPVHVALTHRQTYIRQHRRDQTLLGADAFEPQQVLAERPLQAREHKHQWRSVPAGQKHARGHAANDPTVPDLNIRVLHRTDLNRAHNRVPAQQSGQTAHQQPGMRR